MSILDCQCQERAILRLQKALRADRVPHGYIFHGPEGVGKGLLARQWIKKLLCKGPVVREMAYRDHFPETALHLDEIEDCCDACKDCHLVDTNTHPDVHIVNRGLAKFTKDKRSGQLQQLPIDVIREYVVDVAGMAPSRGVARVFLIEEAEVMNRAAQNALLKTLEEPPANTFLILLTTRPERLLPTIQSRCQSVRFEALPAEFVAEKLIAEGISASEALYWSEFSGGQLGMALMLAKMEGLYEIKCGLVEKIAHISYETALKLAEWIIEQGKAIGQMLTKDGEVAGGEANRQGQTYLLDMVSHAFSDALRYSAGVPSASGEAIESDEAGKLAERFGIEGLAEAIRVTHKRENLIYANVNASLLFESLMLDYTVLAERHAGS